MPLGVSTLVEFVDIDVVPLTKRTYEWEFKEIRNRTWKWTNIRSYKQCYQVTKSRPSSNTKTKCENETNTSVNVT